MKKEIVFILGMHRSGTSIVSNLIGQISEYKHPKGLLAAKADNPKGFFENKMVVNFNEKLLNSVSSCHLTSQIIDNKKIKQISSNENLKKAQQLLNKLLTKNNKIILKDPRFCLTLKFWLKVTKSIKISSKIIFVRRYPFEVIESLKKRNKLEHKYTESLYTSYLYSFLNLNQTFHVIDFNKIQANDFSDIKKIKFLKYSEEKIKNFYTVHFDRKLVHYRDKVISNKTIKSLFEATLNKRKLPKINIEVINNQGKDFYFKNVIKNQSIEIKLQRNEIKALKQHVLNLEKIITDQKK